MRAISLLCGFLLLISLLCSATDQVSPLTAPAVDSSAAASSEGSTSLHWRLPRRQSSLDDRDGMSRYENVCLMLRTYIVVREGRGSDVTRRDGEVICQSAWKFQTRTAVIRNEER